MPGKLRAKRFDARLSISEVADRAFEVLRRGGYWSVAELANELAGAGLGRSSEDPAGSIRRHLTGIICICEKLGHIEHMIHSRRGRGGAPNSGLRVYHWVGAVAKSPYEVGEELLSASRSPSPPPPPQPTRRRKRNHVEISYRKKRTRGTPVKPRAPGEPPLGAPLPPPLHVKGTPGPAPVQDSWLWIMSAPMDALSSEDAVLPVSDDYLAPEPGPIGSCLPPPPPEWETALDATLCGMDI